MEKFSGIAWRDIASAETLLSPIKMGDLTLRNRIVMAPMTRCRAAGEGRLANDLMAEHYVQRAEAGLIISEAIVISEQAISRVRTPGLYTDEQAESWIPVLDRIHAAGGRIFAQLWHAGRATHPDFMPNNDLPVAPSAIRLRGKYIHTPTGKKNYVTPRALEIEEIAVIVGDFKKAAERAVHAGFDGIELHTLSGFIFDQFMQSHTNKRTDRYGGCVENRCRFLIEVLEAVCSVVPSNRVAIHLAPNFNYNDMGCPKFREGFSYAAKQANEFDLGFLHILDGLVLGYHEYRPLMLIQEFREWYDGVLIANGGYSKELAEISLREGFADMVSFGRQYLGNPDLVNRFRNDWPLNPPPPKTQWYTDSAEGYTDFPTYENPEEGKAENFN